jgi:hypothetical protein
MVSFSEIHLQQKDECRKVTSPLPGKFGHFGTPRRMHNRVFFGEVVARQRLGIDAGDSLGCRWITEGDSYTLLPECGIA